MADALVAQLKATVDKLENRVVELEARLHGHGGASPSGGETSGMRMILIGPPGAGMSPLNPNAPVHIRTSGTETTADTNIQHRQGHTGTEAKGEVRLLSSGYRRHAARASCR